MKQKTLNAGVLLLCALIGLIAETATAAERVLVRLESVADKSVLKDKIIEKDTLQLAAAATTVPRPTWKFLPGDKVSGNRPVDRVVELYTGTKESPTLLAYLLLRYYRDGKDWTPQLQVQQEPTMAFINGRWQPVELGPALLVQHGATLPNPEGFFPQLELGVRTGSLSLIGWKVRAP